MLPAEHELSLQRGSHASGTRDEGSSQEGSDDLPSGIARGRGRSGGLVPSPASLHRLDNLEPFELGMAEIQGTIAAGIAMCLAKRL
jgi:hypothetical protein